MGGACRRGDRCSRVHNRPTFSQTLLIQNFYQNPALSGLSANGEQCTMGEIEMQEHYDEFFDAVHSELEEKYGEIEEMNVCDNLGDHLVGNVYVKFKDEGSSEKCVPELNNRWFDGRPIYAELSPVADFREACCRQYELGECNRGGFCNFMHLKPISSELKKDLYRRNKHKRREDQQLRDETAGGKHGGYAGGFGGWSGVGDTFHDRDYGYTGRASTQGGSMRKMNHIDKITGRQNSNQWNGPPRGPPRGPNSRGYPPSNYSSNQGQQGHQGHQGGYSQGNYQPNAQY